MGLFTKAAALISRSFRLSDTGAIRYLGGGAPSFAGKPVTADTALAYNAFWGGTRLISEAVACLPLAPYNKDAVGNLSEASDHNLYRLLRHSPDGNITAVAFWESMVMGLLLWGNSFAEIKRNVMGDVVALLPMLPTTVTLQWQDDGNFGYRYTTPWGEQAVLDPEDVLHVKGFGHNPYWGLSPLSYMRHSLGLASATEEAAGKFFANGLRPASLYSLPDGQYLEDDKQRTRFGEILREHHGNERSGGWLLLEGGAKFTQLTINPDDAQLLETRKLNVEDVCTWLLLDQAMLGRSSDAGHWSEDRMLTFIKKTLTAYATRIQQACQLRLLKPSEVGNLEFHYDYNDLLRADSTAQAAIIGVLLQNGAINRDDLRTRFRWGGAIPGGAGKLYTVQSNLINLDGLGKEPPAQTPEGFGLVKPGSSVPPAETQPIRQ